ncbi:putative periplasmic protein [Vibrio ishigakensis]|uniref:Putative periplasmic protein n=1 Tax=Vibrio ishigakensis TaxID=1481914 RepID=A0A0B8P2V7_9VIBR|nr:putative periplasmic protein [Vibrio ishigakensis]
MELQTGLQAKFVQARKFAVVEENIPGLDYSVELRVKAARTKKFTSGSTKTDPLTGNVTSNIKNNYKSLISVDFKVYRTATGQVLVQDNIKTTSSRNNLPLLKNITVEKLYNAIHEQIFPHRIAKVSGNEVIVASGGDTMRVGDVYEVYSLSEEIFDPYTGESLGQEETKTSELKITRVLPKLSYAKISGKGSVKKHDIIRKKKRIPSKPKQVKADKTNTIKSPITLQEIVW